jgi:TM2 domain-containing membrane protein YozV
MIAGKGGKGALILCLYLVSIPLIAAFGIGILGMAAFWIWGMVAGYTDAQNWNRQRGIIS